MSDMTMLMFKQDCFDPDSPFSFQELLVEAMQIGAGGMKSWTMEFGAKVSLSRNMAETLYAEHVGKPFYERIVGFASTGPSFVSVWSCGGQPAWEVGRDVVSQIRQACGKSNLEVTGPANLIHGSDGLESANREVKWALRCMVLQCASCVDS